MRSIAERMSDAVTPFVGSSGGGQYRFQPLCATPGCSSRASVSASRHTISSGQRQARAAEKFLAQGWTIGDGPICPECRRAGNRAAEATTL